MNEIPDKDELLDQTINTPEEAVETAQDFLEAEPGDDEEQVLTYGEIKQMLQAVFEQGILRGIPMGQDTAVSLIQNDPEIPSDTKEYLTNLIQGGNN